MVTAPFAAPPRRFVDSIPHAPHPVGRDRRQRISLMTNHILYLLSILGDATKQYVLDWLMRFNIIEGVARRLLYLHQDSKLL
jgi:hypothetical protein